MTDLPIPALEMRELVGRTDAAAFDNASGDLVYPYFPGSAYEAAWRLCPTPPALKP